MAATKERIKPWMRQWKRKEVVDAEFESIFKPWKSGRPVNADCQQLICNLCVMLRRKDLTLSNGESFNQVSELLGIGLGLVRKTYAKAKKGQALTTPGLKRPGRSKANLAKKQAKEKGSSDPDLHEYERTDGRDIDSISNTSDHQEDEDSIREGNYSTEITDISPLVGFSILSNQAIE